MSKMKSRYMMLAALLAAPCLVQAVSEREANNPIASSQDLEIVVPEGQSTGGAIVDAVVGNMTGAPVEDLDFFTFSGREGDVVTLDIDGGYGVGKNVDTIMAVFKPGPTYQVLRQADEMPAAMPVDPGSKSKFDAIIVDFKLPTSGTYIVGVTSARRIFLNGGGTQCIKDPCLISTSNGDYTLVITGVSPSLLQINLEIKPGSGDVAPINPKSKGKIPVALLGANDFSVDDVDTSKLTFGHTGNEASYAKCGEPSDVNGDLYPDMVCHFENQAAQFAESDLEAILRGQLDDGRAFVGRGWLKVVPVKAE